MSNSAPNVRPLSHGKPLPNAHNAAFIALALGKADLVSVVVAPRQSNDAAASILACRFASQRARRRFACYWARRTGCAVKADARSQLVFAPVAPLPHGRSEAIGRLVVNPGNGRAFDGRLRAAGLG
jgi:hypothetical protein